jgi:hypothetical protein
MLADNESVRTRQEQAMLSLTLLHNVHLDSCDVTYKRFLSPFPAPYAFKELFAIPFEEFVVGE